MEMSGSVYEYFPDFSADDEGGTSRYGLVAGNAHL